MRGDAVRRFAAELSRLERRVQSQEQWMSRPQMLYSSIDDGSIAEKNAHGEVVSRFGRQEDGTHGVVVFDGPPPPVPSTPVVEGGPRSITAIWGGTYANDVGKYDFRAVEFYAAPAPFQYLEDATLIGSIHDPDGGRITVARPVGTWHVGALTLSAAGRRSPLSGLAVAESESIISGEDLARLEGAFTTSDRPPMPEDGEGKPDGAYWTMLDSSGAQAARWRWVEAEEEWVETPLSVEFIPEAYVDFLAANTGFIRELESQIVHADMFVGREFHGGLFSGTRLEGIEVEGAHIQGGELDIPGALQASPVRGVLVGGDLTLYEDLPARLVAAPPVPGVPLMEWATLPSLSAQDRNMIIRLRLERDQDYPFQSGRLQVQSRTPGVEHVQNLVTNPRGRDGAAGWTGDVTYDAEHDAVLVPADPEVVLRAAIAEVTDGEVVFSSSEPSDTSVVWVDDSGTVREWVAAQVFRNLIVNPRFEHSLDGWSHQFSIPSINRIPDGRGGWAVEIVRESTGFTMGYYRINLPHTVTDLSPVTLSVDASTNDTSISWLYFELLLNGTHADDAPSQDVPSDGEWHRLSWTITPTRAFNQVQLFSREGGHFFRRYTRALLTQEGYDGPYFDGDTPGAHWEGTPHASISVMPVREAGWQEITDPAVVAAGQAWASHTPITVPHQPVADDATLVVYDVGAGTTTRHHNVTDGTVPQTDTDRWVRVALMPGTYHGPYGDGDTHGWNWDGPPHDSTSSRDGVSVVTGPTIPVHAQNTGNIRSVQFNAPSGGWHEQVQAVFIRDEDDETPTGNLIVSDLQITQPSPGDIEVSGTVEAQHGAFDTLEVNEINQGVMLLDYKNISGHDADDPPELHIPEHLIGAFHKYVVEINGAISGGSSGPNPVGVLINGRFGSSHVEYACTARAEQANGNVLSSQDTLAGGWPHTGYVSGVGWTSGLLVVTFDPRGTGEVSRVSWSTTGYSRQSSGDPGNGFLTQSGGFWDGPRQPLTHFSVRPSTAGGRTWTSTTTIKLWGYR